jgi:hypothetical protein
MTITIEALIEIGISWGFYSFMAEQVPGKKEKRNTSNVPQVSTGSAKL